MRVLDEKSLVSLATKAPTKPIARDELPNDDATWSRYIVPKRDFTAQYAPIYCQRLLAMLPWVLQTALRIWVGVGKSKSPRTTRTSPKVAKPPPAAATSSDAAGEQEPDTNQPAVIAERILDLHVGRRSVIVGTLFKEMALKPNVLEQYAKEVRVVSVCSRDHVELIDPFMVDYRPHNSEPSLHHRASVSGFEPMMRCCSRTRVVASSSCSTPSSRATNPAAGARSAAPASASRSCPTIHRARCSVREISSLAWYSPFSVVRTRTVSSRSRRAASASLVCHLKCLSPVSSHRRRHLRRRSLDVWWRWRRVSVLEPSTTRCR